MPPKKKPKIGAGKKQLTQMFKKETEKHDVGGLVEVDISEKDPNMEPPASQPDNVKDITQTSGQTPIPSTSGGSSDDPKKRQRKFQQYWLSLYSWLDYEEEFNFMYCKICTEQKKKNNFSKSSQCRNFQKKCIRQTRLVAGALDCIMYTKIKNRLRKISGKDE